MSLIAGALLIVALLLFLLWRGVRARGAAGAVYRSEDDGFCPACGFAGLPTPFFDDDGLPAYDLCPRCKHAFEERRSAPADVDPE